MIEVYLVDDNNCFNYTLCNSQQNEFFDLSLRFFLTKFKIINQYVS